MNWKIKTYIVTQNLDNMKITQVTPGLITIPPNGWGAIEKVIWNYHLNSI